MSKSSNLLIRKGLFSAIIRIATILIFYFILSILVHLIGFYLQGSIPERLHEINNNQQLLFQSILLILTFLLIVFFLEKIDKLPTKSIGFSIRRLHSVFSSGFFLALFIIGIGTLLLIVLKSIVLSFENVNPENLFLNFLLFFLISVKEELLYRGYIFKNLLNVTNKTSSLIISSLIFVLFHGLNHSASIIGLSNVFLAGVLLGLVYLKTKNIWLPISFHLFWNFLQGSIFGYNVSGLKFDSIFLLKTKGRDFLSGGDFGFEGSILCTLLFTISLIKYSTFFKQRSFKCLQYKDEFSSP